MRFLVLFITILLCSTTIKAQRLYSESGDFYEKSKRSVVDHAKLGVFYELKFRKDSTKLDDYTEAQTVLMVSDKHLLFSDYNRLAFDSINDYLASSKQNKKDQKAREEWMQAIKKWTFFFVTLTDLEEQITMFATRNRSLWLNQTQMNVSTGAVCPLGDAFPRVFFIELGCRFI